MNQQFGPKELLLCDHRPMEAVIYIGIQGSGKTTFYLRQFFNTHVRISLDMLKTRHRERLLLEACLTAKQPFVIDNTNATIAQRSNYIQPSREAGFRITGLYFRADVKAALERNAARTGRFRIPEKGLLGTLKRLERPNLSEGFDQLNYVSIDSEGNFVVESWRDEI